MHQFKNLLLKPIITGLPSTLQFILSFAVPRDVLHEILIVLLSISHLIGLFNLSVIISDVLSILSMKSLALF
jgi:hypothetical protein